MQRQFRRVPALAIIALLASLILAGCSGPTPSNASSAATVNGTSVSMTTYLAMVRLIYEADRLNNPALTPWQDPAGRKEQMQAQQQVLNTLISNVILDKAAKAAKIGSATIAKQEQSQIDSLFSNVPSAFTPLVDQGVLTRAIYRPFVHESVLQSLLGANLTFDTAQVDIITVAKQSLAESLQKQLLAGTADWTKTAKQYSTDVAASNGGQIQTLVPGYLPKEIDHAIFSSTKFDPKAIQLVHSHIGWSLIKIVSLTPKVKFAELDNNVPITPPAQVSAQGAAMTGYINGLVHQSAVAVNVNWCNGVSGGTCPQLFPTDQV
jgi:hypothetical protein